LRAHILAPGKEIILFSVCKLVVPSSVPGEVSSTSWLLRRPDCQRPSKNVVSLPDSSQTRHCRFKTSNRLGRVSPPMSSKRPTRSTSFISSPANRKMFLWKRLRKADLLLPSCTPLAISSTCSERLSRTCRRDQKRRYLRVCVGCMVSGKSKSYRVTSSSVSVVDLFA
jgi:hypothetical protein